MSSLLNPSRSTRDCLDECGGLTYCLVDLAFGLHCFSLMHKVSGHLTIVLILISDATFSRSGSDSNAQQLAILVAAWTPGNSKFGHFHVFLMCSALPCGLPLHGLVEVFVHWLLYQTLT